MYVVGVFDEDGLVQVINDPNEGFTLEWARSSSEYWKGKGMDARPLALSEIN